MALTKLQAAIYMEISEDGGKVHGYEILKRITARGLNWSHQQIYRELKKMDLNCEVEPLEGKPDRKIYSLKKVSYPVDYNKLTLEVILAYPRANLLSHRYTDMKNRVTEILEELDKIADGEQPHRVVQLELEMNRLEVDINMLVKVNKATRMSWTLKD
ncbi:transcriptional regulator [Vibrio phage D81]